MLGEVTLVDIALIGIKPIEVFWYLHIVVAYTPRYRPATVGAFQQTTEQVDFPAFGGCPGIALQKALYLIESLIVDNSLVRPRHLYPFFFWAPFQSDEPCSS